ncbi:MAG: hypothetical protein IT354_13960, partial [Gemmatimonadaceae bacterium]|nr:hypothetical protein [Gemmatimonadaceae bacterium]
MTAPALPRGAAPGPASASLSDRLAREQAALRARTSAAALLAVLAVVTVVAALGALMLSNGRWMAWPRALPVVIWGGAAAISYLVIRWLRARDHSVLSLHSLAGVVEREQSLRSGSLRGALEVGATGPLGARAMQDVSRHLTAGTLAPQLLQSFGKTLAFAGAAAAIGAALLTVTAKANDDGFAAVVHPVRAWRGTLLPTLAFEQLPTSVPRGMPLTVRVRAEGRSVVTLSRRAEGESWKDTTLDVNASTGLAALALGPVRAPVTVRVSDGRAPSAEATIRVDERGWIGDVALFAEYPAYLGRTNETLEPVSPVRVPRGTRVRVSAVLRGGVTAVELRSGGGNGGSSGGASVPPTVVPLRGGTAATAARGASAQATTTSGNDGEQVSGVLLLDRDGTWTWGGQSTPRANGETLPPELPDSLSFVVVPDKAPEVIIASPVSDTAIGVVGVVPVIIRAADDHGVGNIALTLWREPASLDKNDTVAVEKAARRERVDIGDPASAFFEGGVTVPLDGRDLAPGD